MSAENLNLLQFIKKLSWNNLLTAKFRSVTPRGVALAMADQWGEME